MTDQIISSKLLLASRGSMLALWQANYVAEQLKKLGQTVDIKTWKTTGDIIQDRFLHEIGGKGLFIKELEDAMKNGLAHFAVHSLKDMPVKLPKGFHLSAVLKRHSHSDVVIFKKDFWKALKIAKGAVIDAQTLKGLGKLTIATSSLRRSALLASACPNVTTVPIRGNVDTRLKKLESEAWNAIILAEASLERLQIRDVCAHKLDDNWFVPCAGQGALAIESPIEAPYDKTLRKLECELTRKAVNVERAVLARLGGDCTMPFGCLVKASLDRPNAFDVKAIILTPDGHSVSAALTLDQNTSNFEQALEDSVINQLRANGANKILENLGISQRI